MKSRAQKCGWYVFSRNLTDKELEGYQKFAPSPIKFIGGGASKIVNLPGVGFIKIYNLLQRAANEIQSILVNNKVHTIDTGAISHGGAIGLAESNRPGVIRVDVNRIVDSIRNQALPPNTQLDGTMVDNDVKNSIIQKIEGAILQELVRVIAHESKHMSDYFKSLKDTGQFSSSESGATSFGDEIARKYNY